MLKLQSQIELAGTETLPYGRQWIDESDIEAVADVLRSDWLTTGPAVEAFENDLAAFTGARYAVAVSNGTAALHAATHTLGIGPGDEVIVPPITFAATANCVAFQGGTPVFADVCKDTLLLDPSCVEEKITSKTKAIIAVDYAGQPCDYDRLQSIADTHGLALVADSCHALGAAYKGRKAGTVAGLNAFSFHPVKHITTGEGGMITTDDRILADRMRTFRNHGITTDHRQRAAIGAWFYEMVELGYNYRLSDIQCALGISQLRKLPKWIVRRQQIAKEYDAGLQDCETVQPLVTGPDVEHAYHLYVVRINSRNAAFAALRARGIGVNVHYVPVHLHPYYRDRFGSGIGMCPVAEDAYQRIISLPIFPRMTDADVALVIEAVKECCR